MKKTLLIVSAMVFGSVAVAQQRSDNPITLSETETERTNLSHELTNQFINHKEAERFVAVGSTRGGCPDILLEEDFQSQMIPASWPNLDLDGHTDANGRPDEWYIRFEEQSTTPGDTNWVATSSSWFTSLQTANNWLILDAVTICDPSFVLRWWSAPFEGPTYLDGYTVYLSPTGSALPNDFTVTLAEFAEGDDMGNVGPGIEHTEYNGINGVLQQWSVALGAYNGQTVRIAFVHDSYDDNLIAIDDIQIIQDEPYDLAAENVYRGSNYFLTPMNQVRPMTPSGDVTNESLSAVTNPTMTFDVIDGVLANQFSNTQTTGTIAAGATESFTSGAAYTPPMTEEVYGVVGTASGDETDPILSNNTDTAFFLVTDTIFGRETGNVTGALSIGAGSPGVMANLFELTADDWISSISVFLSAPTIGDTIVGRVYSMSGGQPSSLVASTDTMFIVSDQAGLRTLVINGGPVYLPAGSYAVGIEETISSSASVGTETTSYVPGEAWVFFQNAWVNPEAFEFYVAFTIRMNLLGTIPTGLADSRDDGFSIYPNPNNGNFEIRSSGANVSSFEVLNVSGQLISSVALNLPSGGAYSFNQNLSEGIYFVRLFTDSGVLTSKMVVTQ